MDAIPSGLILAAIVVVLALVFDFVNGFHDAANVVATMVSTRAFQPETALVVAAAAEFIGPFLFGTAVAKTIGSAIIQPSAVTTGVMIAALIGGIVWDLVTWYFGIPSSSSHALLGSLAGAVLAGFGLGHIKLHGFVTVVVVLCASPLVGAFAGYWIQHALNFVSRGFTPRANEGYKKLQLVSAIAMALSHGTNDAQKSMGVITMALMSLGYLGSFAVPWWVVGLCAGAMGLGTATGGWRIIKTVGNRIYKLKPINGFAAQTASAGVILAAALLGWPVSTTHIVSSSITGVGSAERIKAVRWTTAFDIALAWVITIPAAVAIGAGAYWSGSVGMRLFRGS
ncbi:MAG: inorganic phosphate transporter [Elusimicrobia bacterium]|nr:inorganic phosphate transporter [Elusimicrobiota bacterium]